MGDNNRNSYSRLSVLWIYPNRDILASEDTNFLGIGKLTRLVEGY